MTDSRGVVLETARLRLREFTYDDADFLVALLNDDDFRRNIGDRGVRSAADARRYLDEGPLTAYVAFGYGLWCVEERDGGCAIGICGLLRRDTLPHPDVGYALLPSARGRGYAQEAVTGVLAHARTTLGLPRVVAIVSPGNVESARVLDAVGYHPSTLVVAAPGADAVWLYVPRS